MSFLQSPPAASELFIEDTDSRDSGLGSDISFTLDFDFTDAIGPKASSPVTRPAYSPCLATELFKSLTPTPRARRSFRKAGTPVCRLLSFGSPASSLEDSSTSIGDPNANAERSLDGSYIVNFNGLKLSQTKTPVTTPRSTGRPSNKRQRQAFEGSESCSKRTRIGTALNFDSPRLKRIPSSLRKDEGVADIKTVLDNCAEQDNLTGDFTQTCSLPSTSGKHRDLKYITPDTLRRLLDGDFQDTLEHQVIDCRYPYEYDGGHIENGQNLYTKDEITAEFLSQVKQARNPEKRLVLVFHCEFSSERGPKLARYLRSQDREMNKDSYPFLHYPEVYVLEGGYKNFFEQCEDRCVPQTYRPMLHKDYSDDLKFYRSMAKACDRRKARVGLFMRTRALKF